MGCGKVWNVVNMLFIFEYNFFFAFVPNFVKICFMKGVFMIDLENIEFDFEDKDVGLLFVALIQYGDVDYNEIYGLRSILEKYYGFSKRNAQKVIKRLLDIDLIRKKNGQVYVVNPFVFGKTARKEIIEERRKRWKSLEKNVQNRN